MHDSNEVRFNWKSSAGWALVPKQVELSLRNNRHGAKVVGMASVAWPEV